MLAIAHLRSSDWTLQLVALYCWICEQMGPEGGWSFCERFSPNLQPPRFTDEELLTVYLFARLRGHHVQKEAWRYIRDHLQPFFPDLIGYSNFNARINRMGDVLPFLIERLLPLLSKDEVLAPEMVLDSFPVMLAEGRRSKYAKVAPDLAGYTRCSTKNTYYCGVKLHAFNWCRPQRLPLAAAFVITPAQVHDLTVLKQMDTEIHDIRIFLDSAYTSAEFTEQMEEQRVEIQATFRRKTNTPFYSPDAKSWKISQMRQPIESFFQWLQQKTQLQEASRVRSTSGLLVHVFGALLVAMLAWFIEAK